MPAASSPGKKSSITPIGATQGARGGIPDISNSRSCSSRGEMFLVPAGDIRQPGLASYALTVTRAGKISILDVYYLLDRAIGLQIRLRRLTMRFVPRRPLCAAALAPLMLGVG